MPRIRTIKPEFWQDEKLARLDDTTRLVFLGIISMADDAGRLVDSPRMIDAFIWPYDDDRTSRPHLDALVNLGRIERYESASGQRLIQIVNWDRHQRVQNPNKYTLPGRQTDMFSRDSHDTLMRTDGESTETLHRTSVEGEVVGNQPLDDSTEDLSRLSQNPPVTIYDQRSTTNDLLPTTNDLKRSAGRGSKKRPSKNANGKAPATGKTAKASWLEPYVAVWQDLFGKKSQPNIGLLCKTLAPLRAEHGDKATLDEFETFLLVQREAAKTGVPYVLGFPARFGSWGEVLTKLTGLTDEPGEYADASR